MKPHRKVIHQSAWKGYSPNFGERCQHEVRKITLPKLFGKWPEASRPCFFDSRKRTSWASSPLLAAFRTPILRLSRFSKQFLHVLR
jgi:hypothetical protein